MTSFRVRQKWVAIGFLLIVLAALLTTTAFADPSEFVTVSIVSTNDFHGALIGRVHSWSHGDIVGSADYLTGYINIVREENPGGVLWLDAGDSMQGTLISNYFWGASTIDFMNAAGVDAMAVGNHEFDWGQEILQDRFDQADFPFLAANVFFAKKNGNPNHGHGGRPHWAKPYEIFEANGIQVGVIGIALQDTPSVTNPINVANLIFTDPAAEVAEVLPEVEADGADMIVVLAHIGGYWPDFDDIGEFVCGLDPEKIDYVISGHSHGRIDDVICGIPVTQAYSSGTAFSRVDFIVDPVSGDVVSYEMNYYPTSTYNTYYGNPASYQRWDTGEYQVVVPDPTITEIVAGYNEIIEEVQNEVIGESLTPITRNYRYESEMGDWVTDIMKAFDPGIDFALTNSGGLRADIDAGPLTFGEVFEALPFDNTLVTVELTGAELITALEAGISGDHGIVQVSGLQFTFDYDLPVGSRIIGDVIDLSTGLALEPGTTYFVAVNDFMAAGGDGYEIFAENPQVNSYVLVRDMVVDWVRASPPFSPPDPAVEQRITAFGTPPS